MNNEGARMDMVMDVGLMDELWTKQMDDNLSTTPMLLDQGMPRNNYWGYETHAAGYILGEINLGKRLTIGFECNYTHVWSETDYLLHRVQFVIIPPGGWLPEPVEADTS